MDYNLALMTGIDFPIEELNLIIHQPTIKEISYLGEHQLFMGAQLICVSKDQYLSDMGEEINNIQISNFDIFMEIIKQPELGQQGKAIKMVLELLFPQYQILMTPRSILFNLDGTTIIIDERNFLILQQTVSKVLCLQQSGQQSFNPEGKKAREIARKIQKARERVARAQQQERGASSVISQYLSVLCVGLGSISLKDGLDLTLYQFYDLIERYSLYINWDLDIRSRLAGAKGEKPVENWMQSIH